MKTIKPEDEILMEYIHFNLEQFTHLDHIFFSPHIFSNPLKRAHESSSEVRTLLCFRKLWIQLNALENRLSRFMA